MFPACEDESIVFLSAVKHFRVPNTKSLVFYLSLIYIYIDTISHNSVMQITVVSDSFLSVLCERFSFQF